MLGYTNLGVQSARTQQNSSLVVDTEFPGGRIANLIHQVDAICNLLDNTNGIAFNADERINGIQPEKGSEGMESPIPQGELASLTAALERCFSLASRNSDLVGRLARL